MSQVVKQVGHSAFQLSHYVILLTPADVKPGTSEALLERFGGNHDNRCSRHVQSCTMKFHLRNYC